MRCSLVNYEESFPHILFAQNGKIYDFEGKKVIVIGDAYSINKHYRLTRDCGCGFRSGRLGCLCLETGEEIYV